MFRRELTGHAELGETLQDLELMRRSLLETVGTMDRFLHAERFRSLAQLVAGVAHEINTPLGIITTAASILAQEPPRDHGRFERPTLCRRASERPAPYLTRPTATHGFHSVT